MKLKTSFPKPDKIPDDETLLPVRTVKTEGSKSVTMARLGMLISLFVLMVISFTIFSG